MLKTDINFKLRGKPKKFSLEHNLDEFGLSLDAAFVNWSVRTKDFSQDSFIEYVKSKDPVNIICKPIIKPTKNKKK